MRMTNLLTAAILAVLSLLVVTGCTSGGDASEKQDAKKAMAYQEQHRPQFHFTPEANWMNDPNGMYYYEGQYHLFYQYYPDSTVWGPMHWGHATSEDLVTWDHQPIALYPDSLGCIFSGGAVVDHSNTSGLGAGDSPPIVATFTHHDFKGERAKTNDFQKQSIAYSQDGGQKWIKYGGNPVIPNTEKIKDFRDPKVVWHEASQKWVLVLAAYDRVKLYASPNLIDWEYLSDFGIEGDKRLWECPDLIPMQVEGSDETKWVLIVSIQQEAPNGGTATSYFVGDFDGRSFMANTKDQKWLDWGTDNYAFVTWNNAPSDSPVVGIGWMSNWQYAQIVPTEKWRSAMTIPRELRLVKGQGSYQINSLPVNGLQQLRGTAKTFDEITITEPLLLASGATATQAEVDLTIDLQKTTASSVGLTLENDLGESVNISIDTRSSELIVDRTQSRKAQFSPDFFKQKHRAPIDLDRELLHLQVLIDVASVEIFVNEGEASFTSIFFPTEDFNQLSLVTEDGTCHISQAAVYPLASIW